MQKKVSPVDSDLLFSSIDPQSTWKINDLLLDLGVQITKEEGDNIIADLENFRPPSPDAYNAILA